MPKEKVREAIEDMLRRGLSDLDPVIALMRRGPAALDELALAAGRPAVKDALVGAVRRQAQRFAAATASMQKSVRRHSLTIELLQAAGGEALAHAALVAWDEGRRDDASYLADAAAAAGVETTELLVVAARVAAAAGACARSADLFSRALDKPLTGRMLVEAARALFDAGRTESALLALASGGEAMHQHLAGLAAAACLRGEVRLVSAVVSATADGDGQAATLYVATKAALRDMTGHELQSLAGVVAEMRVTCDELLVTASEILLQDDPAATIARLAAGAHGAADRASDAAARAAIVRVDDPQPADPVVDALAEALGGYGATLAPVIATLLGIAADLQSAADLAGAIADNAACNLGETVSLSQAVSRIAREASERCAELIAFLEVAAEPAVLMPQLPGQMVSDVAARIRPTLSELGLTLHVTAGASPAVRIDRAQVGAAVAALTAAVARQVQRGGTVSLELLPDPAAGIVRIVICSVGDEAAAAAPLAVALAESVAKTHGGSFTALVGPSKSGYLLSLPAERPPEVPIELAELTPDAQMALRAAVGMLSGGDTETACFLIDKGVNAEAARRLRPHLARHLLLPRAAWALSSGAAKAGLTGPGAPIPGRRVEELCRAASDDRLQRRVSGIHAYGLCLVIFAFPRKGWPLPAEVPGLSAAETQSLADNLLGLANLLANKLAKPALDAAQAVLKLLLKIRTT